MTPLLRPAAEPRLPPVNTEAEQALLGAILVNNIAYGRVADFLLPEHFGNAVHGRIYAAIGDLFGRGVIANPVTLKTAFENDDALREIGGAQYLGMLVDSAVTVINAPFYARDVVDCHNRRLVIEACARTIDAAHAGDTDLSAALDELHGGLRTLAPVATDCIDIRSLTIAAWLAEEMVAPNFLLGELLSTTSRMMLVAPTGLGKTNFTMALCLAIAGGQAFLHWRAGQAGRVIFIDGEMSKRLMRRRLQDAVRRYGPPLDNLFVVNRERFPDMPPLNLEAGQRFINRIIEAIGAVDLIVFDNIQSLLVGDMKDEESWQQTLPWVRDLTRREIGQLWVHHTGWDEKHSYGSSTREWQLDTVALMERVDRPESDIAFRLSFPKARERSPDNRDDFEPAVIVLSDDEWSSERGTAAARGSKAKMNQAGMALEMLVDVIARHGTIPPANEQIPPETPCVAESLWREHCIRSDLSSGDNDSRDRAFRRAAADLRKAEKIRKWDPWVWIVR